MAILFTIDEVSVERDRRQHYSWRAVDQDSEVVDVYFQARRNGAAAKTTTSRFKLNNGN
ncbi:DDE-type integrase/transposase/recombinase [Congregibacter sp.]|uniref:DDE-type integrase/transposase/recombinase n=1 Tax=Congregibacter sp. TaxID=2744308 RepID=UPI00385D3C1E